MSLFLATALGRFYGKNNGFYRILLAYSEKEPKTKSKSRPLPKATQKYLEAEEEFTQALDNLEIKYEKKFQFKSTKHWRFDFHLIEHHILVEIAGGPWSGGRKGKLKTKLGVLIVTMWLKRWVTQ